MELLFFFGAVVGVAVAEFTNSSSIVPTESITGEPTSTFSTATNTYTGNVCCFIQPAQVALDQWWNQTITATVATVVTQYLQYNNTVVTSLSTEYNTTATRTDIWTLDTQVFQGAGIYDSTSFYFGTTTVAAGTTVASPTPFWGVYLVYTGLAYEQTLINGGTTERYCNRMVGLLSETSFTVSPSLIYFPTQTEFITTRRYVLPGDDFVDLFTSQLEGRGTTLSGIESCTVAGGEGAPTLHVPMSALTAYTDTTIAMGGSLTTSPPGGEPPTNPDTPSTPDPTPSPPSPGSSVPAVPVETDDPAPPPSPPNNPTEPTPPNQEPPPSDPESPPPGGVTSAPSPNPNNPNPNGPPAQPPNQPPPLTIGTNTIPITIPPSQPGSPSQGGVIFPGSTTLLPGSTVVIDSSTTLSLDPSGSNIVILGPTGTSTVQLPGPASPGPTPPPVINLGTSSFTISSVTVSGIVGIILPNGETLLPETTTVIDGTTWDLAPGATELVVGTSTIDLPKETGAATTTGDGFATATSGGSPAEFTGGAASRLIPLRKSRLNLCGMYICIALIAGLVL